MRIDGIYISVAQAARILCVDEGTVRLWIRQGRLPAVRVGGGRVVRILRADLALLLAPVQRDGSRPGLHA